MTILLIPVALNLSPDRTLEERLNFDFWTFVNFAIHKCPYYGIGGGNSESALWEIGAGPRFLKLPPLLAAAAEISYSNTFQECSRKLVLSPLLGIPSFFSHRKLDHCYLLCPKPKLTKLLTWNNLKPSKMLQLKIGRRACRNWTFWHWCVQQWSCRKSHPCHESYNNHTPVTKSGSFMAGAFKETLMGNMIATTVNLLPKPLSDLSF